MSHAAEPDKLSVAVLLPGGTASSEPGPAGDGVLVRGYGPGGPELAGTLAASLLEWAGQGRPGTRDVRLTVWQRDTAGTAAARLAAAADATAAGGDPQAAAAGGTPAERDGLVLLDRPSVVIEVGWPRA